MSGELFGLGAAVAVICASVCLTAVLRWPAFLVIYFTSIAIGLVLGTSPGAVVGYAVEGFSKMAGYTAILIVSGLVMGELLASSGAGFRVSRLMTRAAGTGRLTLAAAVSGYLMAIPLMCCDTAFLVLSPIMSALAAASATPAAARVILLACATGAYTSFKLVAPSPGPLALISALGADFATTMALGAGLSVPVLAAGLLWAGRWSRRGSGQSRSPRRPQPATRGAGDDAPCRASASTSDRRDPTTGDTSVAAATGAGIGTGTILGAILVPIGFIAARSILRPGVLADPGPVGRALDLLGHPAMAMPLGAGIMAILVGRSRVAAVDECIAQALRKAGPIVFVVGAGGALGAVLGHTTLPQKLGALLVGSHVPSLVVPFAVASVIKTIQGSSLVSLTTAPAIVAPLLPALGLSPEMAALSVMAGALAVVHVNDSFFWLVTRSLDLDVSEGYRSLTMLTLIQSLVALTCVALLSLVLP